MKTAHHFLRSSLLGLAIAAACLPAGAAVEAPPAAAFFNFPAFDDVTMSPTGRYLAMRVPNEKNDRYMLAVYDSVQHKVSVVAKFASRDVASIQWVNDERILFNTSDKRRGPGETVDGPGLFAVNADGTGYRQLVTLNGSSSEGPKMLPWNYFMGPVGAQDSEWVYVLSTVSNGPRGDVDYVNMLRLNTVTGRTEGVKRPPNANAYTLDDAGQPRLVRSSKEGESTVTYYLRDGDSDEWRELIKFDAYKPGKDSFEPVRYTRDGTLYVLSRQGDKSALYTYDVKAKKLGDKPVVQLENYDFSGVLRTRDGKLLGVSFESDAWGTMWLDPEYKALQDEVDKQLPGTINLISVPRRGGTPNVLVTALSDTQPKVYLLYNRDSKRLEPIGQTRPQIAATRCWSRNSAAAPATATACSRPAGSSGA